MSKIKHVSTIKASHEYEIQEIIEKCDSLWFSSMPPAIRKTAIRIFENAEIQKRASAFSIETVFSDLSFEERNNLYIEQAISMSEKVLRKALQESNTKPEDLDFIITTSCTGFMIPSVDAYLIDRLGLKQNIIRLPVTEMGCAGGTSALTYAHQFMKNNPKLCGAVLSIELPTITFQKNDLSMENLVSTAIFADGASCVILGETEKLSPKILDTHMYHFPESTKLMGYYLQNSGLKIILDREVPNSIDSHFPNFFYPILEKNHLKIEDIDHFLFHPGGKKIIRQVESFLQNYGKNVDLSKHVLQNHGNMSSSTILFILENMQRKNPHQKDLGYLLAFGPGFSAQSLLVEWQ